MPERDNLYGRVSRLVSVTGVDGTQDVRINLDRDVPLGLRIHDGDRDAMLRIEMSRSVGQMVQKGSLCRFAGAHDAMPFARRLVDKLRQIASKPISQKHVDRLLDISSAERLRWTKDGRLPTSGTASFTNGKAKILIETYPPDAIEALAAHPEIILRWREIDAADQPI